MVSQTWTGTVLLKVGACCPISLTIFEDFADDTGPSAIAFLCFRFHGKSAKVRVLGRCWNRNGRSYTSFWPLAIQLSCVHSCGSREWGLFIVCFFFTGKYIILRARLKTDRSPVRVRINLKTKTDREWSCLETNSLKNNTTRFFDELQSSFLFLSMDW